MTLARNLATVLQRRLDPRVAAPLGSVLISVRQRQRCAVRYAGGDWVHRYRDGTVVQPFLGGASARLQDRVTMDVFLHGYRPAPGDTVVDLGAGVGSEARLLSRLVGPSGRVLSVEAHPRVFGCLRRTVELNRLDNVTPVWCAVTAAAGEVLIETGADDEVAYVSNGLTTDRDAGIAVPGRTLSDLVRTHGLTRIDLLKLNIEGAELPVLRAAADVLPMVANLVVSCHDFKADQLGRHSADELRTYAPVRALLADAGYTIRTRPDDPRPWIPHYLYASR